MQPKPRKGETTMTHTSTPWSADIEAFMIYADGKAVADTDHLGPKTNEEAKANAAFIVKAVNCHHELVEELQAAVLVYEDIVGAMDNGEPYTLEELTSPAFTKSFEKARAAIAKALSASTSEAIERLNSKEIDGLVTALGFF
jgi:predicted lipid-binding transport protein (Tim44 family)